MLDKFKKLYRKKYNVLLTDEEATQMATELINLMRILLMPDSKSKSKNNAKERGQDETIAASY